MERSTRKEVQDLSNHIALLHEANPTIYPVLLKGRQLNCENTEAVIIGGMVLDIHAIPSIPANPRTTTPGKVHYFLGGVARNVAECMSKLGTKPYMISAVGLDMAGNLMLEQWESAGLSTEGILKDQDIETPVVCNIFDNNGELAAAVASVEAIEKYLTPEWIIRFRGTICSTPVLMIDANLNSPSLEASCQMAAESGCPVWFEPVSVAKSQRITSIVKYVTFASPNEDELIAMANALSGGDMFSHLKPNTSKSNHSILSLFLMLKPAIWVLLEKGIKVVVVTLGSYGVFLCCRGGAIPTRRLVRKTKPNGSGGHLYKTIMEKCPPNLDFGVSEHYGNSHLFAVHFPSLPALVVRLTGAGDCLVGGTLSSICAGLDITQSVAVGIAVAKSAVEAVSNVPKAFNLAAIADDANFVYSGAKVLFHQSML